MAIIELLVIGVSDFEKVVNYHVNVGNVAAAEKLLYNMM